MRQDDDAPGIVIEVLGCDPIHSSLALFLKTAIIRICELIFNTLRPDQFNNFLLQVTGQVIDSGGFDGYQDLT